MTERNYARLGRLVSMAILFAGGLLSGCDGAKSSVGTTPESIALAAPTISIRAGRHGAVIVGLTPPIAAAQIYYTLDGSTPNAESQVYEAPLLLASNLNLKAIATAPGSVASAVASYTFTPNIAPGTLVWSDEFANASVEKAQPDPLVWRYDTGDSGFGNSELENYCAWGSSTPPCDVSEPNAYVGKDGNLHIVARQPLKGIYTSARMKSAGLFGFQYGRVEVRARVPEAQGLWPAIWMLGSNISTVDWPSCGELDILERVDGATMPDWNEGSVHGPGFTGTYLGTKFSFPAGQTAAGWHIYGMLWSKDKVAYYVDDPAEPYVTYTTASLVGLKGARWPFDDGQSAFLILNLAVGGSWPGSPAATTRFPVEMLVDYVRVYTN